MLVYQRVNANQTVCGNGTIHDLSSQPGDGSTTGPPQKIDSLLLKNGPNNSLVP